MNRDILKIGGAPIFDDRIVKIETHTYNPYANTTFGYSDEIRIPIQHQDLYTLPCESVLYIEGKFVKKQKEGSTNQTPKLTNNCVAFMFDEIRYELDGVEIDRNRNVGITSTIKNYISLTAERNKTLENAGWKIALSLDLLLDRSITTSEEFNFCVPLNTLLGFCEDYKRIVINARHELVLIRARNDNNCVIASDTEEFTLTLSKVQWKMPHVILNDVNKLSLLRTLENGRYLSMGFRSWDLYEFPLLQSTTKHSWAVKTTSHLEKPRYVILSLQTGKRNVLSQDSTHFDACALANVKLFLNSDFFPYDDMNVDFERNKVAILYDMYAKFANSYYGYERNEALLSLAQFISSAPLVVIDCSRQNESVKSATVDIRIEFECRKNIPSDTTAYCLIIHDRLIEYNPLTNVVRKII
ncbi:PREDICTED: uncharacterized protein LOC108782881 [Cyphomyrmex costatus]|uniref:Double jelly roll-like domain-containing protein n=1 Tax=Cyphomyrmex costatus TaxID=456900 RepID=A0A151IBI8_9HYME|nr:PREDICTED: uncharacterized protein LOC108778889 [Cyphomyrmex costatus]XP_018406773.1 PREDICTED: uncharacterized protein LOC108782881 [Cyphomyrmex costatus]KYM96991.1 hypothetical protein ALC62_12369 [Cyphomyrmex costatus]KYN06622.1 hypothetical protein ALC62_02425 [Cyphomyrmex costatus]